MSVSFSIRIQESVTLKSGKHPIVLQTIWKNKVDKRSKVRHKRIGVEAKQSSWDYDRFKNSARNSRRLNSQLNEVEDRAWEILDDHFNHKPFNYKRFVEILEKDNSAVRVEKTGIVYQSFRVKVATHSG